ncbi:MAG: WYL domain-containing protein, partial [Clostridia bacterium]|nr:WYL domain-containing protein [Clostridia bacterium]
MAKRSNQKLKLIYTLDILKKYSDEQNPLNANEIAQKLLDYGIEAERKSIYNDIACLDEYGCDI